MVCSRLPASRHFTGEHHVRTYIDYASETPLRQRALLYVGARSLRIRALARRRSGAGCGPKVRPRALAYLHKVPEASTAPDVSLRRARGPCRRIKNSILRAECAARQWRRRTARRLQPAILLPLPYRPRGNKSRRFARSSFDAALSRRHCERGAKQSISTKQEWILRPLCSSQLRPTLSKDNQPWLHPQ